MEKKSLEISWGTLWRVLLFVLFATALVSSIQIVLALFLAVIISSGLEFLIDFLERRGIPRTLGVILVFLAAALVVVIIMYLVLPFVVADINVLFAGSRSDDAGGSVLGQLLSLKTTQSIGVLINKVSSQFFADTVSPVEAVSQVLGGLALAIAALVSAFYLSLSHDGAERFIRAVFPSDQEERVLRIYERSKHKIGSWFRTQIVLSFLMGILVWISLGALGVKHAFLLGLITGVFELMPFVGPILSGAVATLFAASVSTPLAIYTVILFTILHQFESHFLVPVLTRKSVGLHPVLVIAALLIGIHLGGALGGIVAVPAAAVLQEIVDDRASRKIQPIEGEA